MTLKEISEALKSMKNNKSPGMDGFPAEFFKFYWKKLQYFVLRSLNESYMDGILPLTLRQCVISCLPKGNKPRELLKNWRPISLLNVVYKICSASIANRLKSTLYKVIDESQTGFLPGRFIGESTRLVYDIMDYCERHNQNGLLMLIDFEKAFDSVSWNFLYKVLKHLNFGDSFVSWIKLFNKNITGSILQCGILSESFPIGRGCRQGDPISAYLFILCVQFMSILIKNNPNIRGITINDETYTMTQFADDTTLLLDGTEGALRAALNTIEIFGNFSGLRMNKDKTKIIWIGRKKISKDKLNVNCKLVWGETEFDLLGIKFTVELHKILDLNYKHALIKIENTLHHWKKRYLTPLGKITIIKTFAISKLNHLFSTLPSPNKEISKALNQLLYKFLWDDKPDKVKREQITQCKSHGGLSMINISNFIQALKVTWIRRLYRSQNSAWVHLFETTVTKKRNILLLGSLHLENIIQKCKNAFWKDTLWAWLQLCEINKPVLKSEGLTAPLWLNPLISTQPLHIPDWYDNNISFLSDIVNEENSIMTLENIRETYNVETTDFLTYHRLKMLVTTYMNSLQKDNNHETKAIRPFIPFYAKILTKIQKVQKIFIAY